MLLLLACAPSTTAWEGSAEAKTAAREEGEVMVTLRMPEGDPRDLPRWVEQVAAEREAFLDCATPRDVRRSYATVASVLLGVEPGDLEQIASCPQVEAIVPNRKMVPFLSQSIPLIGADVVQASGVDGTGTSVAIIDTGVTYTQAELGGCLGAGCKVVYGKDVADNDSDPDDCEGHGTNVAAIAAGTRGVAPGADIVALKVFSSSACTYTDDALIAAALDEAILQASTYNIVAVNMSLGVSSTGFSASCDAVAAATTTAAKTAWRSGLVLVSAAGNDGYSTEVSYPACLSYSMAVANSYDSNVGGYSYCLDSSCSKTCTDNSSATDQINCSSNGGSLISLAAPGTIIEAGGQTMSGTSQASPHVTGAVALVAQALPSSSASTRRNDVLRSSATVYDGRSGYTYPRLDLKTVFTPLSGDLVVDGYSFSGGDGDLHAEAGETLELDVELTNESPGPQATLTGTLYEADPDVQLGAATDSLPSLAPEASAHLHYSLTIGSCSSNHDVSLDLSVDVAGGTVSDTLVLPIVCVIDEDRDGFSEDDCDDTRNDVFPGAEERCDGVDQDCDGAADNNAVNQSTAYLDGDGDGYGGESLTACELPEGTVVQDGDCDDTRADIHPDTPELCDDADQDCNGLIDDNPTDAYAVYPDRDGDGLGDSSAQLLVCTTPGGYVETGGDCDDTDPSNDCASGKEPSSCACNTHESGAAFLGFSLLLPWFLRRRTSGDQEITADGP